MEYGAPEEYGQAPVIRQPPSTFVALPTGAATDAARKSPVPKISSCACSLQNEPTCSEWPAASVSPHAAWMSPWATSSMRRSQLVTSSSRPPYRRGIRLR